MKIAEVKSFDKRNRKAKKDPSSPEFILEAVKSLNSSLIFDDVIWQTIRIAQEITDSERGLLFLEFKGGEPWLTAFDNNLTQLGADSFIEEMDLIKEVKASGISKYFQQKEDSDNNSSVMAINTKTVICTPISIGEEIIGVLYTDSNRTTNINLHQVANTLEVFSSHAAIAIKNSNSYSAQLNLNVQLEEAKDAMEKATGEIGKAEKMKYEFLAQMSHEIRTPINKILGFTSILKEHFRESFDRELISNCKIIDSGGKRLVRTIDLMLNMSQIKAGTYEIEVEKFNLFEDVINNLRMEFAKTAKDKGLSFELINNSSHCEVVADMESVTQIFQNLVHNAMKYTIDGEVEVLVYNNESENICVEVRDTGIGMSEEFLQKIFTPFTQEQTGYTRPYEGNGLALALVKEYCTLNNIELEVRSVKGEGSTFKLTFLSAK